MSKKYHLSFISSRRLVSRLARFFPRFIETDNSEGGSQKFYFYPFHTKVWNEQRGKQSQVTQSLIPPYQQWKINLIYAYLVSIQTLLRTWERREGKDHNKILKKIILCSVANNPLFVVQFKSCNEHYQLISIQFDSLSLHVSNSLECSTNNIAES